MLSDFVLLQFLQRSPRNSTAESRNERAVHTTVTRFVPGNEDTVTLRQQVKITEKHKKLDSFQSFTDVEYLQNCHVCGKCE